MTTVLESQGKIGTTITRPFNGLMVRVKINDVKMVWGEVRYLVSVDGQDSNLIWIRA